MKTKILLLLAMLSPLHALASDYTENETTNFMEEFDPFSPDAEKTLELFDQLYQEETGLSPFLQDDIQSLIHNAGPECYRASCRVYAKVVKSEQRLYLYVDGSLVDTWLVSTGVSGHNTPDFDTHPSGRIYDKYSSNKYPGGDYNGLGNMPYVVFIRGGFGIHGTPSGNWPKLGRPASHGCIRVHPDNGFKFNRLVRSAGINNTWITVQ